LIVNGVGVRIAGEFGAVEQYLKILSEYLPLVRDQTRLRSEAELKRKYPKHSSTDFVDEYEGIEWVSNTELSKKRIDIRQAATRWQQGC
jgi:hypothetical protein